MTRSSLLTCGLLALRMLAFYAVTGVGLMACASQPPALAKSGSVAQADAPLDARVLAVILKHRAEILAALSA